MEISIFGIIAIAMVLIGGTLYVIGVAKNEKPFSGWKTSVAIVCFMLCVLFAGIGAIVNQKTCPECERSVQQNVSFCPDCGAAIEESTSERG